MAALGASARIQGGYYGGLGCSYEGAERCTRGPPGWTISRRGHGIERIVILDEEAIEILELIADAPALDLLPNLPEE